MAIRGAEGANKQRSGVFEAMKEQRGEVTKLHNVSPKEESIVRGARFCIGCLNDASPLVIGAR